MFTMLIPRGEQLSFEQPIEQLEKRLAEIECSRPSCRSKSEGVGLADQVRTLRGELVNLKLLIYANLDS